MNPLQRARDYAKIAHGDQQRKFTGKPYIGHLEDTAHILWEVTDGQASNDAFMAALLHDTVEDTNVTLSDLSREFGKKVEQWVNELTTEEELKNQMGKKKYLTSKMDKMSNTAFTIKLSDRLSNILDLDDEAVPDKFVKWYLTETKYILSNLTRPFEGPQKLLLIRLQSMISFLELKRNL